MVSLFYLRYLTFSPNLALALSHLNMELKFEMRHALYEPTILRSQMRNFQGMGTVEHMLELIFCGMGFFKTSFELCILLCFFSTDVFCIMFSEN